MKKRSSMLLVFWVFLSSSYASVFAVQVLHLKYMRVLLTFSEGPAVSVLGVGSILNDVDIPLIPLKEQGKRGSHEFEILVKGKEGEVVKRMKFNDTPGPGFDPDANEYGGELNRDFNVPVIPHGTLEITHKGKNIFRRSLVDVVSDGLVVGARLGDDEGISSLKRIVKESGPEKVGAAAFLKIVEASTRSCKLGTQPTADECKRADPRSEMAGYCTHPGQLKLEFDRCRNAGARIRAVLEE